MVGPVYPASEAVAKWIYSILAFNIATGPIVCRGVFQSVAYPAQIRHLQKPYQSGESTLGTGQQSTW